ncbi:MAG: hypothetical protein ACRD33_07670 [Candidatus Acidiferrales bacterium]
MADFSGAIFASQGQADPSGRSSDVTAASWAGGFHVSVTGAAAGASAGAQPAITVAHGDNAGSFVELFGGELFGKIVILPTAKALGNVLTATQFPVEVWNTFRDTDDILNSIIVSGSGNVTLADPLGEPLLYAAMDSRIYQATVPSTGDAVIFETISLVFSGGESPSLPITGARIVVFSVAPDWSGGMKEKISYLTDVLKSYSDNEQRRGLRQLPRRSLAYRAMTLTPRLAAGMESLVWGWQHEPYAVPWWPDAGPLLTTIAAGSFAIPAATADRMFAVGGLVLIWQDEFTFEALNVTAVASNSISVSSPTQFQWNAGYATLVMPLFLGRLSSSVKVDRLWSGADSMDLEFSGESGQLAPAPAASLTQYRGFDVLETQPNWESDLGRDYKRSLVVMDPKIGPLAVDDKGGSAVIGQEFPWYLASHAAVTTFRAFILARFGRLNPFWIPTFDQDLVLAANVLSTDTAIAIQSEFYTRFFFPLEARRFIAFIPVDGTANVYRQITASVDNGNGTETLTLDSATGKAFTAGGTMISFLTLARLASDDAEIDWMSNDLAQASLGFQEVPRETP